MTMNIPCRSRVRVNLTTKGKNAFVMNLQGSNFGTANQTAFLNFYKDSNKLATIWNATQVITTTANTNVTVVFDVHEHPHDNHQDVTPTDMQITVVNPDDLSNPNVTDILPIDTVASDPCDPTQ
jgi:hypothetical protein